MNNTTYAERLAAKIIAASIRGEKIISEMPTPKPELRILGKATGIDSELEKACHEANENIWDHYE